MRVAQRNKIADKTAAALLFFPPEKYFRSRQVFSRENRGEKNLISLFQLYLKRRNVEYRT